MNKSFVSNIWTLMNLDKKEKLISPVITAIQDHDDDFKILINFSSVPGAESYKIYVNNRLIDTTSNLSYTYQTLKSGIYNIYVRAYGSAYSPSDKSNIVIIDIADIFGYLVNNNGKYILANSNKIILKLQ